MSTTVQAGSHNPVVPRLETAARRLATPFAAVGRWLALALMAGFPVAAQAQAPVIVSFGSNGALVCTNLLAGSTASVEWASSVLGPWTNSWADLAAVTADTNGAIRVSVPMFYRVRGTPPTTNPPAPAGMVLIPAGAFTMGNCMDPAEGNSDELPLHTNQISAFYMDKYEVTKVLWDEVRVWANTNGYDFGPIGSGKATDHPVQMVSWYDCVKWCNARSEKAGRVPAYYTSAVLTTVYRTGSVAVQNDWVKWNSGYRLPTEAEWEKAARGGASGRRFPWSGTNNITHSLANYYSASVYTYDTSPTRGDHPSFQAGGYPYTSPVNYFVPNGYGLHGMAGNVYEWCWDWYGLYASDPQTDPRGAASGAFRVIRGGGWYYYAFSCRAADRNNDYGWAGDRSDNLGFRSVLPLGQP